MIAPSVLTRIPLFAKIAPDYLTSLAEKMRPRSYRRSEVIFHQGDPGTTLHLIQSGRVKILLTDEEGREIVVAFLSPGDFFGELALLDGMPRSATAVAQEDTKTLSLQRSDFLEFLSAHAEAAIAVSIDLAARLRLADQRLAEAAFLDLHARLAKRLLELAEQVEPPSLTQQPVAVPVTQNDLAAMAGASRQRVNLVLGEWEHLGYISRQRGKVLILKSQDLRRRASS